MEDLLDTLIEYYNDELKKLKDKQYELFKAEMQYDETCINLLDAAIYLQAKKGDSTAFDLITASREAYIEKQYYKREDRIVPYISWTRTRKVKVELLLLQENKTLGNYTLEELVSLLRPYTVTENFKVIWN